MAHRSRWSAQLAVAALAWLTPAAVLAADSGVPLSRLAGGLWTVPATVAADVRPLRLVLDTGAERTVLDAGVVRGLGLAISPGGLLDTPAGRVEATMVRLPRLTLGPSERTNFPVLVADLSALGVEGDVDGILGMDALTAPFVQIDFTIGVLSFGAVEPAAAPGMAVLPMRTHGVRLVVDVQLDGQARALVLDSGAETIVLFEPPGEDGQAVIFGAAGVRGEGRLSAADVALGAVRLGSLPVLRVGRVRPRLGSDGVLPAAAFARLHIDRAAGVVHVVPRPESRRPAARSSR